MKSFFLLALCVFGLANAATPIGPVYRSINSTPVGNLNKPEASPISSFQPTAEARESPSYETKGVANSQSGASSVPSTSQGVGSSSVVPTNSMPTTLYYYQPTPAQQYPAYQQSQPVQSYNAGTTDLWTKYRMNDVMIGGAALGLILAGGYLVGTKLWTVRGRALRELSQLDADDLSRMAKSVFQAIDKVYNKE